MAERITGHTELTGPMAYPIRHSSSPAMQNEVFVSRFFHAAFILPVFLLFYSEKTRG